MTPAQTAGADETPMPLAEAAGAGETPTPLAETAGAGGTPTPLPEKEPQPAAEGPAEPAEPAKPWAWQVASVKITNSTVRVLSDQAPLDVGVTLSVDGLSSAPDAVAKLGLTLAPPQGTVQLDAQARIAAPQVFGALLKIDALALPPLVAVSGALPVEALPSATLRCDLKIDAGLTPNGDAAPADLLQVSGTLGVADLHAVPPQAGVDIELKDLDLKIDHLAVPGVIPLGHPAAHGAALDAALTLALSQPHITVAGEQPVSVQMQQLTLTVPSLSLPAALAKLGPADGVPVVTADIGLALQAPHVGLGADATTLDAQSLALNITGASIPVRVAPAAAPDAVVDAGPAAAPDAAVDAAPAAAPDAVVEAAAPAPPIAPPAKLALQLDVADLSASTAQGKELVASVKAIGLKLSDVVAPGFVAGAPIVAAAAPLTAGAVLTLSEPKVARADGKEFSVSAKAISVPLTSVSMPGSLGGQPTAASPLRLSFGEIRLDAPAIRATRTKAGIVLPESGAPAPATAPQAAAATPDVAAAPSPAGPGGSAAAAAAPKPPLDVQIQALRLVRGSLQFTDRVVQPVFTARYAPIEVEARNIKYPDLTIKPLKIELSDANQQGKVSLSGDLTPDSGTLTLKVDQLNLSTFNPYATTYSSYSIADGALSIDTTAKLSGGKYDVTNAITLHQFDLAGAEGDSLFEQNFGISLSMALALLRDMHGDIGLGIPIGVDQQGNTQIDLMAVVRSALKQALVGAISSPLKLLGVGGGSSGGGLAPAPIAFRLGRAAPTTAGVESANRLAGFLAGRPGMAVDLATEPTADDVRWLREQALRGEWKDAGMFAKALALVSQRGPRERIGAYLEARGEDRKAELSGEDQAVLQQWLDERPAPSGEPLRELAAARLAAVQAMLNDKGIGAARVRIEPPSDTPVDGAPIVTLKLDTAERSATTTTAPASDAAPAAP
ncbi:MAG: DUF748 domain-containing protein [bacterium]